MKKEGKKSQTEIASQLGLNYYLLINNLHELKKEKMIKKEKKGKRTYWYLNRGDGKGGKTP